MAKPMWDPDALISMFESATAKQGEQLRKAVSEATLRALQSRELTLKNIRSALKAVGDAAGQAGHRRLVPGPQAERARQRYRDHGGGQVDEAVEQPGGRVFHAVNIPERGPVWGTPAKG